MLDAGGPITGTVVVVVAVALVVAAIYGYFVPDDTDAPEATAELPDPVKVLENLGNASRVAFSSDGRMLATSGFGVIDVRLWDLASGEEVAHHNHVDTPGAIAFSPDGRLLAVSAGESVYLWDLSAHQLLVRLESRDAEALAFTPDSSLLASAGAQLQLWSTSSFDRVASFGDAPESYASVAFSPDGRQLAAANRLELELWDVATQQTVPGVEHSGAFQVAFSANAPILASAAAPYTHVVLWNVTTGEQLARIEQPHLDELVLSPDGDLVAMSTFQDVVVLWDTTTPEPTDEIYSVMAGCLAIPPDAQTIAICQRDGEEVDLVFYPLV